MEQEIFFTNKDFEFSKLTLSQPMAVQGGAYFTKIKCNSEPFYIQTPKCVTKQGINETSKKAYMDLMFSNEDEEVIEWFETLESTLINLIFQKKHLWFQDDIEYGDIENFFNPITRAYKGGKYHLIRTSITKDKNNNHQYTCNVYDENENVIPISDIKDSNIIIPILEVVGVKFSARSFQVELIGKQIMCLNNKPLFSSCLIKRKDNTTTYNDKQTHESQTHESQTHESQTHESQSHDDIEDTQLQKSDLDNSSENIIQELLNDNNLDNSENSDINENSIKEEKNDLEASTLEKSQIQEHLEDKSIDLEKSQIQEHLEDKSINLENNSNDLEDISEILQVPSSSNNITLKKPNEVYYEIYKIAKQKAKQHKKAAISAYLEAKKIKNTYLLEDLDNSDDSSDDEYMDDDNYDNDAENIKNEINDIIEELH
jgi:hypothetical protein